MKKYKTYLYFHFDESIEEENTYGVTLTKKFGNRMVEESNQQCWLGHIIDTDMSTILKTCWSKEDVDLFVEDNPECSSLTFCVWKRDRNFRERNWREYCPLSEKRDLILNEII